MTTILSIKQIRVLNDLTQKEMAELLGMSEFAYRRRETGESKWSLDDIVKIKKHFEINIDNLKEVQ